MAARTVAIFGGSFNPPHLAHQMVCLVALETAPVDEVWMVPCYRHAFGKELAPYVDRVAMCRLAAKVFAGRVTVSEIESELGEGESRTFHTIRALAARHPDVAWRMVVGEDILAEKESWYRWDELVEMAPLIVVGREDGEPEFEQATGDRRQATGDRRFGFQLPDVSSTEIRERLKGGEGAVPLVSRAVMDYIAGRGLYR